MIIKSIAEHKRVNSSSEKNVDKKKPRKKAETIKKIVKKGKKCKKKNVCRKPTPFTSSNGRTIVKKKSKTNKKKKETEKSKQFITLNTLIKKANQALKKSKLNDVESAINVAKIAIKKAKRGKKIRKSRVIALPYSGGDLEFVPVFVGLNANGLLLDKEKKGKEGTNDDIINAINDCRNIQKHVQTGSNKNDQKEEEKEEEKSSPEVIKLRRSLYLYPYKNGYGLYSKIPTQTKN